MIWALAIACGCLVGLSIWLFFQIEKEAENTSLWMRKHYQREFINELIIEQRVRRELQRRAAES